MKLQQLIENHWYHESNPLLTIILFPFSLIYRLVVALRRLSFILNIKSKTKLGVPVVIVGNMSVGGAGKTPLTKYLAEELTSQGIKLGIILRGYKSSTTKATVVKKVDSSSKVGDEALIYAQSGFNVVIGAKRVDAAKLLLKEFPATQLIIADDGLQHYYLERDLEICVIDSSRMLGNQQMLPLGPLREPLSRLKQVDAIVINGNSNQAKIKQLLAPFKVPTYHQKLELIDLFNPVTGTTLTINKAQALHFIAMAAIGNPTRFFNYLKSNGLSLNQCKTYPDHYHYQRTDIDPKYAIITTEKDYTKLAQFKAANIWVARVKVIMDNPELITTILKLIQK